LKILVGILLTGTIFIGIRIVATPAIAGILSGQGIPGDEAYFLAGYPSFAILSLSIVVLLWSLVKIDKPESWREYLAVRTFDGRGTLYALFIGFALNFAEIALLNQILFKPVESFLEQIGFPAEEITGSLPAQYLSLNLFILAVFWWIEVPEELFFRGYVQNRLQDRNGKNVAVFLSAILWDLWHIYGAAQYLRRFFFGLIFLALVFRWRQNSYPVMISHSIGNRLGVAFSLIASTT
jgi:membrane protease YdiL (CAAX protease family)